MSDRRDIETTLKDFHHETDPHVRDVVMSAFRQRNAPRKRGWGRPVPLYAAVVAAALMGFVSLLAGISLFQEGVRRGPTERGNSQPAGASSTEWHMAERGLL